MSNQLSVKLVVVGDGSVGKTCLLISYSKGDFPTQYIPTVFENYSAKVQIDGKTVNLGLYDTAGQEEYNRLRTLAYPSSDIIIIVFSVIEPSSFVNARKKWYDEIIRNVGNLPILFVGNKIDMRDQYKLINKDPKTAPIQKQSARKIIEDEFKSQYMECSAMTQEGLQQVFDRAMRIVINKKLAPTLKKKNESSFCNLI